LMGVNPSVAKAVFKSLRRPYIRKWVREEVEARAPRAPDGRFLDANTGLPIDGKYDRGHKPGHEHWREAEAAEKAGLTQKEFNERMNNPDFYQIESPSSNRGRKFEDKSGANRSGATAAKAKASPAVKASSAKGANSNVP
jgi:hypothetical protein